MSNPTILVVDDEPANLQKLRRTFIHRYTVLAASGGAEALELARARGEIAVIIADQRMPGMTGVEFLRRTMEILPDAVRIILTGYTDVEALMEAINTCRVFRYVVKPWDPPDLLMTVERALENQRLAVENARYREELIRRERLAQELEIASRIQRYILPAACPAPEGYEIAVEYHPAREVGGDLYDFFWDPAGRTLQAVVGDVSGKSIPAALYGAVFGGQLQMLLGRSPSPARALTALNGNLTRRYQAENYISAAFLHLDLKEGTGLFCNAGMPYPYLVRGGEVSRIAHPGVPLGLLEEAVYDEVPITVAPGDTLLLVSDGCTEAVNPQGEMYDDQRTIQSIVPCPGEPAAVLAKRLYASIARFIGAAEAIDDITILVIKRKLY